MHHSVALRGGRSNHSARGANKVIRVRPATSYYRPMMMHFIFILYFIYMVLVSMEYAFGIYIITQMESCVTSPRGRDCT